MQSAPPCALLSNSFEGVDHGLLGKRVADEFDRAGCGADQRCVDSVEGFFGQSESQAAGLQPPTP
jgi:hypothetical protein